jgi:hypothetical protein
MRKVTAGMAVMGLLAGCSGFEATSAAWHSACPTGLYASESLNRWFQLSWDVTQGHRGPQVEGYVYNTNSLTADRMILVIERLDGAGQVTDCSQTWMNGTVPSNFRSYFASPVPDAAAKYRVRVLSFDWLGRGGGGGV